MRPSGRLNSSETNTAPPAGTDVVVVGGAVVVDVEVVDELVVVEAVVDADAVVERAVVVVVVPLCLKV
jgi:hypothetical protein